jgi:hypothetical protein
MDPITLSTAALAIATPYLVKGGESLIGEVAKDLWSKIKEVFATRAEEDVLKQYIQEPSNLKNQAKVEYVLESEMKNKQTLMNEFSILINEIKSNTAQQKNIEQSGTDNILINDIVSSNIKISKK